jgi:hypothetical protein
MEVGQLGDRQVQRGRNVAGLMRYLGTRRREFWSALQTFHEIQSKPREDFDTRYVLTSYLRERDRLANANSRAELIEAWLDVLVLAAERMKNDEELARRYEAEGLHPDEVMVAEHLGDYAAPESHYD